MLRIERSAVCVLGIAAASWIMLVTAATASQAEATRTRPKILFVFSELVIP